MKFPLNILIAHSNSYTFVKFIAPSGGDTIAPDLTFLFRETIVFHSFCE